jgi:hypothetical protein
MMQSALIAWVCSAAGLFCAPAPTVSVIQTAYEREAATGNKLHDQGLKVIEAKCHDNSGGPFLCEVTFVSADDPNQRLYFDIVAVAPAGEGWELKSGLCKR